MNKLSKKYRDKRKRESLPPYTSLGCPLTKNMSGWCFFLCSPDKFGNGKCGRKAPHAMKSRIQLGIIEYEQKKLFEQECG